MLFTTINKILYFANTLIDLDNKFLHFYYKKITTLSNLRFNFRTEVFSLIA